MFLGKIVADETLPLAFRTDQMKAAELNYIEKHLDAAIARRKKGIRGYSLESFEKLFDDEGYQEMIDYTNLTEQSLSDFINEAVTTYLKQNNVSPEVKQKIHEHMDRFLPLMASLKDK